MKMWDDIKLPLMIAFIAITIATCTNHYATLADRAVDDWAHATIYRR
jgi:hypothetical protein